MAGGPPDQQVVAGNPEAQHLPEDKVISGASNDAVMGGTTYVAPPFRE